MPNAAISNGDLGLIATINYIERTPSEFKKLFERAGFRLP